MELDELIGTWRLCSFELRSDEGDCYHPYGENPKGLLIYDKKGYMSGIMSKADRPLLSTNDLRQLSASEKLTMADNINAYAGRYTLLKDRIVHEIEVSLVQNAVGTFEDRFYSCHDRRLVLSSNPVMISGKEFRYYITWERI